MRYEIKWKAGAKQRIKASPNKIIYATAWNTLQKTIPFIPWDTKRMRNSSMAYGVKQTPNGYQIGSATYYARKVWLYNQTRTHWSHPPVYSRWYAVIWKREGNQIFEDAVKKYGVGK